MSLKTGEYQITTSARSGTLTVTDAPDQVRLTLKFDRYGVLGDEAELERKLRRVFDQWVFDQFGRDADAQFSCDGCDRRPIVLTVPDVGGRSLIIGGVEQ